MRESLTIQRAIPSSSAALLAETIEALARTDREGASEASAEALHLEAIEILKHAPAAESLHLMRAYLDLAEVYEDHKQYEKAVDEYEKAVPLAIQYYRANQAIPAAVTEASLALALTRDSLLRSRKIKETEKLWSVELELVDECGDQRRVFDVLKAFARFCEDHEVADETARTAVTRLFTVANELGEKDTRQWCLNLMADMELRMGNAAKATPSLFMEQGGEIATGVQAALEFKNGNYSQAEKLFGSCIDSSLSRLNPGSDQLNL